MTSVAIQQESLRQLIKRSCCLLLLMRTMCIVPARSSDPQDRVRRASVMNCNAHGKVHVSVDILAGLQ